ncbi:hypothetical protein [Aureimonas psammosilenae]|uniref:hypothetical protein n=1 Tax=Aureimonas psammosilenae TaxID=2495496 RepID=UPI0012611CD0|nr:hypothetical protein [Aureimonas psammosilenae]
MPAFFITPIIDPARRTTPSKIRERSGAKRTDLTGEMSRHGKNRRGGAASRASFVQAGPVRA